MEVKQLVLCLAGLVVSIFNTGGRIPACCSVLIGVCALWSVITISDGVQLDCKDWGPCTGQPIVFSHGWTLNSDSWESQMIFLASPGMATTWITTSMTWPR